MVDAETPEAESRRLERARRWVALRTGQQLDRLHAEAERPGPDPFDWWGFRSDRLVTIGRLVRGEVDPDRVDRVDAAIARHLANPPREWA